MSLKGLNLGGTAARETLSRSMFTETAKEYNWIKNADTYVRYPKTAPMLVSCKCKHHKTYKLAITQQQ